MGGKRVAKDYWTFDELAEKCRGRSEEEIASLHATYNKMHGIDPKDFYPPEIAAKRMNAMVRACLLLPPADADEVQMRQQIAKDMGLFADEKPK